MLLPLAGRIATKTHYPRYPRTMCLCPLQGA